MDRWLDKNGEKGRAIERWRAREHVDATPKYRRWRDGAPFAALTGSIAQNAMPAVFVEFFHTL